MALTSFTSICPLRTDVEPGAARDALSALPVGTRSPFAASARTHFARLQMIDELCIHGRRPLDHPGAHLVDRRGRRCPQLSLDLVRGIGRRFRCRFSASAPARPTIRRRTGSSIKRPNICSPTNFRVGLPYVNSAGPTAIDIRLAVLRRRRLAALRHRSPARCAGHPAGRFSSHSPVTTRPLPRAEKLDRATSPIRKTKVAP